MTVLGGPPRRAQCSGRHTPVRDDRAEREGFEPSDPVTQVNSLAVSPIRPLSHLSQDFRLLTVAGLSITLSIIRYAEVRAVEAYVNARRASGRCGCPWAAIRSTQALSRTCTTTVHGGPAGGPAGSGPTGQRSQRGQDPARAGDPRGPVRNAGSRISRLAGGRRRPCSRTGRLAAVSPRELGMKELQQASRPRPRRLLRQPAETWPFRRPAFGAITPSCRPH